MSSVLFGIVQRAKDIMPDYVIRSDTMDKMPPDWWYKFKRWERWYYATDADGRPLQHWFPVYFDCCWSWLGFWIEEVGDWAWEKALELVRLFTGFVQFGYATFESWVTAIRNRVGTYIPWFSTSLADAARLLYNWLPPEIRDGVKTWQAIWSDIIRVVHDWAMTRYDTVRSWYWGARQTLEGWVSDLRSWWLAAASFLDDFRYNAEARVRQWLGGAWDWLVSFWNNPFGTITGYLGETWNKLYAFARDALEFYYNLWGQYSQEIGAFWSNPLRWLYDRVEDYLVEKW